MDMQFDKMPVPYLQKVAGDLRFQEQTLEVRLPDGMPDIGRVLGAWGQVIVRGKEWNSDTMAVSCGVMAWVLYTPEDGDGVRSVEAWLPFQMKWDLPDTHHDGKILVSCLLKGIDARSTSARKLMVRANLSALAEGWLSQRAQVAIPGQLPEDVSVLTATYPVQLPVEAGEKSFVLEEQLMPPAGNAKPEKLLYYSLQPEIIDKKVMAGKVVFRGSAIVHILYRGEDEKLYTWDADIPFSQYADLDGEYEDDPSVWVQLCVTSLDISQNEEGFALKAGLLGQYILYDRTLVTVAEDAYSPRRPIEMQTEELRLPAVLDRNGQILHGEANMQTDAQQLVDVCFYPSYQQSRQTDEGVALTPQAGVHKQLVDVLETDRLLVDIIFTFSAAVIAAGDHHFTGIHTGKYAVTVIQDQRNLCKTNGISLFRSAENHILHLASAQSTRGLLAHDPADGIRNIRFSAAIGANDRGDILPEGQNRLIWKRFEALNFKCL